MSLSPDSAATLFAQTCDFIAGAASVASLPQVTYPEIAFIGRSNVGKSSLINALANQKALARVSQNPGLTKQLNFFNLGHRLVLVDMPGYGYAKVSKTRKGEWDLLIRSYLVGRITLKRACLLIDARRGVMPPDEEFMNLLDETAVSFQIVLTKIDTLTEKDLGVLLRGIDTTLASHVAAHPKVVMTSSLSKDGIEDLREELLPFALKR